MKTRLITLLASLLITVVTSALERVPPPTQLSCIVKNSSGCNVKKPVSENTIVADSLSCIYYSYNDSTQVLTLSHINAGFNCCMKQIICTATIFYDEFNLIETEKGKICKCNCLYSFDVDLYEVEAKKYKLKIIEPLVGNQTELNFELDLIKNKKGSFCVDRKKYPWHK